MNEKNELSMDELDTVSGGNANDGINGVGVSLGISTNNVGNIDIIVKKKGGGQAS
jgi:bacteriocin-like protein